MQQNSQQWLVVVNDEEQYSVWAADRDIPQGWRAVGVSGPKENCLDHIERTWTDMRPLSLRSATAARSAPDHQDQDTGPERTSRMTTAQPLMPRTADAWGQLLLDCHTAGLPRDTYFEICERDDGYISGYDAVGFFASPDAWPELDRWAFARFRGQVLDIGVGAGRFAVPHQDRGGEIVGLDVSADALDVCRRRGLAETFLGTVDDLPQNARFDTFLLLGRNLGLLESREHAPRLLSTLARLARPGARIVGTGMDPYLLDGAQHAEYLAANQRQGRMSGQMRLRLRHRLLVTNWYDYLFASLPELEELTEGTGWQLAEAEWQGAEYGVVLTLT